MSAVNRHFAHSPHGRCSRLAVFSFHTVNTRLHDTMSSVRPRRARTVPIRELGERAEQREVPDAEGRERGGEQLLGRHDFENWWFISIPSTTKLGSDAERSRPITTSRSPTATATTTSTAELIAVTGTWPLGAPACTSSRSAGRAYR